MILKKGGLSMETKNKETATVKILNKLIKMKKDKKPVKMTSYYVERELIPKGIGALSCSRILRALRSDNLISYNDPRKNNHIYEIYFNKKEIRKFLKQKIGGKNVE
jgi:hypothetical protein